MFANSSFLSRAVVRAGAFVSVLLVSHQVSAAECGGELRGFLAGVKAEAVGQGISKQTVDRTLANARIDKKVLGHDRAQGVFKQTFLQFAKRSVSGYRLKNGAKNMKKYSRVFARAEKEYGVPAPVITAFWALETDFGAVQGDINTVNALVTLAHDCRRPELFRPQLIAAMRMVENGDLDPSRTTGAWAGEIGQVQMLPSDIVRFGVDGDGDGHVDLKKSSSDAILTAAHFINDLGWRRGEPWMQEITVPARFPWEETGLGKQKPASDWAKLGVKARNGKLAGDLPASLVLPQGRKGTAFLLYRNFDIYLEWNKSLVYTITAGYLATRIGGSPRFNAGSPEKGLSDGQMKQLQNKLKARGYDVGKVDGILGAKTREAVQTEQKRLGLPADAWPTAALVSKL